MDPGGAEVEDLKTKVRSMMNCVTLIRQAAKELGISNSISAVRCVPLNHDSLDSKELMEHTRDRVVSEFKELANLLLLHLKISNFSFLCPERDDEVEAMEMIAKGLLLRLSRQRDVLAPSARGNYRRGRSRLGRCKLKRRRCCHPRPPKVSQDGSKPEETDLHEPWIR